MRWALTCFALSAVACGQTKTDVYAVETNQWDDVATAPTCNDADPTQNCLEARPTTFRIDNEAALAIESANWVADTRTLTLQLKKGVTLPARVKEGTILYRGRKDRPPLLHRIDSLTKSGQTVTATLSPVSLKSAFKKGRVRARLFLSDPTATMTQPLVGVPGVTRQPLDITLGPADCSGNVVDAAVSSSGPPIVSGHATLDLTRCKFQLKAWVDLILEWDEGFANLDKFELSVGGAVDSAMHARLRAVVTGAIGKQFRIWEGPEIPFTVGGIVVTVNPSLFAGFNVSGEADLTIEHGFDLSDSIEVGFGYSDRLDWYSIDERHSNFTQFGPNVTFDGRITATAYLLPRLDVKALGLVGATVTLKTFAEANLHATITGNLQGQLCRSLNVGVTPAVGAVVEFLGVQLYNETVDLVTLRVPLVKNDCTSYAGTIPSNCDPVSECCLDSQCPIVEPGTTTRCRRGAQTSAGLYRFSCQTEYPPRYCTTNSQCADDQVSTVDSCVDNSCEHAMGDAFHASLTVAPSSVSFGGCAAPACCHEQSDCADGSNQRHRCQKTQGSTLADTGTCQVVP